MSETDSMSPIQRTPLNAQTFVAVTLSLLLVACTPKHSSESTPSLDRLSEAKIYKSSSFIGTNLDSAVGSYLTSIKVRVTPSAEVYEILQYTVISADFNKDLRQDALILSNINNGHPTFDRFSVAVILSDRNTFKLLTRTFGHSGNVVEFSPSSALISYAEYSEIDPSCCRSVIRTSKIEVSGKGIDIKRDRERYTMLLDEHEFQDHVGQPLSQLQSLMPKKYHLAYKSDENIFKHSGQTVTWHVDDSVKIEALIDARGHVLDPSARVLAIRFTPLDDASIIFRSLETSVTNEAQLISAISSTSSIKRSLLRSECQTGNGNTYTIKNEREEFISYFFSNGVFCGLQLSY